MFEEELLTIREQGLYRSLKPSVPSKALNFCSNNYLGLAGDMRLIEAACQAAKQYGAGSGAARLISGNFELLEQLEAELADFKGTPAALLFNSGYHANIGAIPALAAEGDIIFSDELNHASLIDGCRLSKAQTVVFRHNDLNHLEELLRRGAIHCAPTRKIIVTEAVFSMEGDLCPLKDMLILAEKYGVVVYLDEAHAVGVLGDAGQGLAPSSPTENLIVMGTLGKAFGSYGAFIACSGSVRDFLINRARSFIFSTALPPFAIGASLAALKIIREEPDRRKRLWDNIDYLQQKLGWKRDRSPIFSLRIGSAQKTMEISQKLFEDGIYLQGIRPPTVPEGTSRLRLTLMSEHQTKHLERFCEVYEKTLTLLVS